MEICRFLSSGRQSCFVHPADRGRIRRVRFVYNYNLKNGK